MSLRCIQKRRLKAETVLRALAVPLMSRWRGSALKSDSRLVAAVRLNRMTPGYEPERELVVPSHAFGELFNRRRCAVIDRIARARRDRRREGGPWRVREQRQRRAQVPEGKRDHRNPRGANLHLRTRLANSGDLV